MLSKMMMFRFHSNGTFIVFLSLLLLQFVANDGGLLDFDFESHHNCTKRSSDRVGKSAHKQKLVELFTKLSSQASVVEFYNTTVGKGPEKVYGLFQCVKQSLTNWNCSDCIRLAISKIAQECPSHDEAIVWFTTCMLRYAKRSIFSKTEVFPLVYEDDSLYFQSRIDNQQSASLIRRNMIDLIEMASFANTSSHYAYNETELTSPSIFLSYAQCTGDLDGNQCNSCLKKALAESGKCCNIVFLGRVLMPSCQLYGFVYDYTYYDFDDDSNWYPTPTDQPLGMPLIAVISSILVGTVLLVNGLLCYLHRRKAIKDRLQDLNYELPKGDIKEIRNLKALQFDFATVKAATKNFSKDRLLGEGGFGEVYMGKLGDGREIAAKVLSRNSEQGTKEFKNEVLLLAKLQHKHLVQLLGFCISGKEKMLIYELVPNSSLDQFLFDPHKCASLDLQARFRIIDGVARGILYLHEDSRLKIIHRDLKTSNILLDEAMNAKISDFGLAKLFALDETQGGTMRVVGTYGYMAPEYAMAGQFSAKSDVYSFGVIVLEIISGQKNSFIHQQSSEGLLYRAWRLWNNEDAALELVDPMLCSNTTNDEEKLLMCIHIALLCIQEEPTNRPKMASVVASLNGQSIALPSPRAPHFFRVSAATYTDLSLNDSYSGNKILQEGSHSGTMSTTQLCPR